MSNGNRSFTSRHRNSIPNHRGPDSFKSQQGRGIQQGGCEIHCYDILDPMEIVSDVCNAQQLVRMAEAMLHSSSRGQLLMLWESRVSLS